MWTATGVVVVDVEWDGERDEGIVWQRIGEGRSISSLFPQRIHKTRSTPRELATVILHTWLDTSRSPSQRQRAPLSSFVRSPRLHGSFAESRLLFLHSVMNASNWNSCIPGTSRKGTCHCEAPKFISLANSSINPSPFTPFLPPRLLFLPTGKSRPSFSLSDFK